MTTLTDTQIADRMPRGRYFIMHADGTFWRRNEYGKALRFAFSQLPAARNQSARLQDSYILDTQAGDRS